MDFTRANPSPRYVELLALYRRMHDEGVPAQNLPAAATFSGVSLQPYMRTVGGLIARFGCKTLLDYGAGKAQGYEAATARTKDGREVKGLQAIWGLDAITLYDPGFGPHASLPAGTFDAVICTDVLEHCPEEDLRWIVGELVAYARKFVLAGVASYPAAKTLPNGENAHVTIRSPG